MTRASTNGQSGAARSSAYHPPRAHWHVMDYVWFLGKNIVGWILILLSLVAGPLVPGPGGLPMFIIGFALVTFPGKRKLTARVLRGKPVDKNSRAYRWLVAVVAILVPLGFLGWVYGEWWPYFDPNVPKRRILAMGYLCFMTILWILGLRGVHIINLGLKAVPRIRRKIRPWLRHRGLDLLPPRRRKRLRKHGKARRSAGDVQEDEEEILEIDERQFTRARRAWRALKPWLIRLIRVGFIVAVFWWMLRPIFHQWNDPQKGPDIRQHVFAMNWWFFATASVMFSLFLFIFRVSSWRWIMVGFGHPLPLAPATRIWSFSELARYIPGAIWQIVGRVYLAKPYGVSGGVCSASQLLELAIFMLANIIVALSCLLGAGFRKIPADHRHWLFIAMGFVPALLLLLHPKIFYGLLNRLMAKLNKPLISQALGKRKLTGVVLWNVAGLLWQSMAIWILTSSVLDLELGKWYLLAGAYCLAWTMGFSVGFISPGGMGVREFVFITTLQFILPAAWVARHFPDPSVLPALAGFIAVLLRLWSICGELLMASVSYVADFRGAMNHPDAPGRVRMGGGAVESQA